MSKQFYFNQSSFSYVRNLNVKTVLFKVIQFSICTQFSSIWPIDKALSGATTPSQGGPGSDGNKELFRIPQTPALLEPNHQIV